MTLEAKKTVGEFQSQVPVFEVELTRQKNINIHSGETLDEAVQVIRAMLGKSPVEQMLVLYLDIHKNIIGVERIGIGTITSVATSFSTLMRGAILSGVEDIIIAHNHTIGPAVPSDADLEMTGMALSVGAMLGIKLYDHIILGPDGTHYSMWDNRNKPGLEVRAMKLRLIRGIEALRSRDPLAIPLI